MAKRTRPENIANQPKRRTSGLMVALLALVFLSFMAVQWKERQRIATIEVVGATGLSRLAVQHAVDTLLHRKAKQITLANVRQCVEDIPYVREASVYFVGVRDICIDVRERLPVAHVVRDAGVLRYVDDQGIVLPEAIERTAHNVPLLHSINGGTLTQTEIRSIVGVLNNAARILDPRLYQSISEVRYDQRSSSVEIITDESTWRLGKLHPTHTIEALADMNVFWNDAAVSMRLAAVMEVDLRWRHQIVLRYRSDGPKLTTSGVSV